MMLVEGCVPYRKVGWLRATTFRGSGDRCRRRGRHSWWWSRPPSGMGWRLHSWAISPSLLLWSLSVMWVVVGGERGVLGAGGI